MRIKTFLPQFYICAVLFFAPGVLPVRAHSASEVQIVAGEIQEMLPAVRAEKNEYQRNKDLRLMAGALARTGNLEAALQTAAVVSKDATQPNARDEVWRITARRLAWQGNIAAATRSAHRIQAEYSRADALLAVARAQMRAGNTRAAKALLETIEPTIRRLKVAQAIAYFAWQWARVGEAQKARELFAHAKSVREPNQRDIPGWPDYRAGSIAFYEAKSGFTADALKTVGKDWRALTSVKAVLAFKRDWQPLISYARTLESAQEINFLLGLAFEQLKAGDKTAARESWQRARTRFDGLPTAEAQLKKRTNTDSFYLPFALALVEVLVGNEETGRARFAQIPFSPAVANEYEYAFRLNLIAAPKEIPFQSTPQQQRADEKLALAAMAKMDRSSGTFYNFLDIARAQKRRGDIAAMRETLALAKAKIRADLVAPPLKAEENPAYRLNKSNELLSLAKFQREVGERSGAGSTLAQAMLLRKGESRDNIAFVLLRSGFIREAASQLEALVSSPDNSALEKIKNTTMNNWNPLARLAAMHAKADNVNAALRWVMKISDASLRVQCLSAIAYVLTPTPHREAEFMLSGARFSARIYFPGYGASYNSEELFD